MENIFSGIDFSGKNCIAFFDLDRTIIRSNSGRLMFLYAWERKILTRRNLAKGIWMSMLYKFGLRETVEIIRSLTKGLAGIPEASFLEMSKEMFYMHFLKDIRNEMRERILFHKKAGMRTVMLSSGLYPICSIIANHLEIDAVICSELETEKGVFTGNPRGQFCFGPEKVKRLTEYCAEYRTEPADCWYYGDSRADLEVLGTVGHPVCVSPDRILLKEASRRGWEIIA